MPATRRVTIIDDDPAVRDSLALLLTVEGFEARAYPSARAFLSEAAPSEGGCVVTDVRMPEMGGLELIAKMREQNFSAPIIAITAHGDVPMAVQAMKLGAVDFLEKPFDHDAFVTAIRRALDNARAVSTMKDTNAAPSELFSTLTLREKEVLAKLLEGMPNKAIARDLGISVRTVEVHRANVMAKSRARNLAELVRMALSPTRVADE